MLLHHRYLANLSSVSSMATMSLKIVHGLNFFPKALMKITKMDQYGSNDYKVSCNLVAAFPECVLQLLERAIMSHCAYRFFCCELDRNIGLVNFLEIYVFQHKKYQNICFLWQHINTLCQNLGN
mmetsp:Transcript_1681/g.2475  ORF Transcript_1681/g.2475 Transcript_1681/m.2475 type:complete len:124 (-) Transcript_1681:279-650(-)